MNVLTQIAMPEKLGRVFSPQLPAEGLKAVNHPVKMKVKEALQNQEKEKVQG